jgi:hypothetical protein
MATLPQHTKLTAKLDFEMRRAQKSRAVRVHTGDRFWVTNSQTDQNTSGFVLIDRKGKGVISAGYPFKLETLQTLFNIA